MSFLSRVSDHYTKQIVEGKHVFRCKYCSKDLRGTTRVITHLAGVKGKPGAEATPCPNVPLSVRQAATQYMQGSQSAQAPQGGSDDEVQEVQASAQAFTQRSNQASAQAHPQLKAERANDLVFMFSNMQLIRRHQRLNEKKQYDAFVPWQWFDSASEESEQESD